MLKAAMTAALILSATPALAEDGRIYDPNTGNSWSGSMSEKNESDDDRAPRTVDTYSNDGERTGSARVDSDGRAFSNETGRGIGNWRPSR